MLKDRHVQEEDQEKENLLNKICQYYEYFPELIVPNKRINGNSKIAAIELELKRCDRILRTSGCMDNVIKFDRFLGWGTEMALLWQKVPVQGLFEETKNTTDMVMQELKEFAIKYEYFFSSGPEWRYFLKWLTRVQTVIDRNTGKNSSMHQPVQVDISEKYSDL